VFSRTRVLLVASTCSTRTVHCHVEYGSVNFGTASKSQFYRRERSAGGPIGAKSDVISGVQNQKLPIKRYGLPSNTVFAFGFCAQPIRFLKIRLARFAHQATTSRYSVCNTSESNDN
jgi:hypothetical protein